MSNEVTRCKFLKQSERVRNESAGYIPQDEATI